MAMIKNQQLYIQNSLVSKDIIRHGSLTSGQELIVLISPCELVLQKNLAYFGNSVKLSV